MKMGSKPMRATLLYLLVALFVLGCGEAIKTPEEESRPVKSMVISGPQEMITRQFPGKILANKQADLSFDVSEKLITLPIREGQLVEKGQLLARVEPKKYIDRLNEKRAKFSLAKAQFNRARQLMQKRYISQSEYDILESQYQIALANMKISKRDLGNTFIYAPFTGIVAKKYVENFELIEEKQPILNLHNLSQVDIEIFVPEYIMMNLKDNSAELMAVFPSNATKKFPVKLKEFSSRADPDTQTYNVVFTMEAPDGITVLPGMSVNIVGATPYILSATEQFFLIPVGAVFMDEDEQPAVWLINQETKTVNKVPVAVTRMASDYIRVTQGIKPGDRVVVAGVHFLQEGDSVRP